MVWAHATNSMALFNDALECSIVTSIECDVMMSSTEKGECKDESGGMSFVEPILAHPPHRNTGFTVATMLGLVAPSDSGNGVLQKHLKLDFKEMVAVQPTFDLIQRSTLTNTLQKTLTLNADILPGPGKREKDLTIVPTSAFIETCFDFIQLSKQNSDLLFALSLGYRCDWRNEEGYRKADVAAMIELADRHELTSVNRMEVGLILALNARLLVKNISVFDGFLNEIPQSRILAWTGSGEPSIPQSEVDAIGAYYRSTGRANRIEFDCNICL